MSASLPLSSIQAHDEWLQRWTAAEGGLLTSLGWWIMTLRPLPLSNPSPSFWLCYKGNPVDTLPLTRDPTLSQLGVAAQRWDRLWHYLLDSGVSCRGITACTAEAHRSSLCGMIRRKRSETNLQWWIQKVPGKKPERKIRRGKKTPLGSKLTLTVRHGVCWQGREMIWFTDRQRMAHEAKQIQSSLPSGGKP